MRLASFLLVLLSLTGCGTLQIGERNFIHPDAPGAAAPARLDANSLLPNATVTDLQLASSDGAILRGVQWHQAGARLAILYFGGNGFHLDRHASEIVPLLAACGTDVVVFDYRGYGRSNGIPSVANMSADAVRVYDQISASHPGGVIVHGQSLGSFLAAHVAQQRPGARALVLEATTSNVPDWVEANMPWYAKPFLTVELEPSLRAIDNIATLSGYPGATLVLAGERDTVTPLRYGRKVFDALPGSVKTWHVAAGADHNGILASGSVAQVYCRFAQQVQTPPAL